MSDSNDNLNPGAAEATTPDQVQTEGAEGSVSKDQQTASTETTGELIPDKFKGKSITEVIESYQNLEKAFHSQKRAGEAAKELGLTDTSTTDVAQVASQTSGQEAQQIAQQSGGDALENWYKNARVDYGDFAANQALFRHIAKEQMGEILSPVNQQIETTRSQMNVQAIEIAARKLAEDYDDWEQHSDGIKAYWQANPAKLKAFQGQQTSRDEKYEILENAYLRASRQKQTNATGAAKVAGAIESRQRDQMKSATVTGGAGTGRAETPPSLSDSWAAAAREYNKGRSIFDD